VTESCRSSTHGDPNTLPSTELQRREASDCSPSAAPNAVNEGKKNNSPPPVDSLLQNKS
jgi:hypothetical protein